MPPGTGKTLLVKSLQSQERFYPIDVDERLKTTGKSSDRAEMAAAYASGDIRLGNQIYNKLGAALKDEVRAMCKLDGDLKVLFVTSCFEFAKSFKYESLYVVAPSRELNLKMLDISEDIDAKKLTTGREDFVRLITRTLPKTAIHIFDNHEQLQSAVRERFHVVSSL